MTDYPDYQTPQAHATAIYGTRVPAARGTTNLGSKNNQTLAAGATVQLLNRAPLDQPSFEFILNCQLPSGALGTPFTLASFSWIDPATVDQVALRHFINASGDNVENKARVLGPVRAGQLTLSVTNEHASQQLTYDWSINAVSHFTTDDDYSNNDSQAVSGYQLAASALHLGLVAFSVPTIAPGTPQNRLTPAINRRCKIVIDNGGQANACQVQLVDPAPSLALYGTSGTVQFYNSGSVPAGAAIVGEFQMPNGPALLVMTNLGVSGNISPTVSVVALSEV